MRRVLQLLSLALAVGLCAFFACRAQPSARRAAPAAVAAPALDAGPTVDAAPAPVPEVYLPASKSGGVFIEHQQAPR